MSFLGFDHRAEYDKRVVESPYQDLHDNTEKEAKL